MIHFTCRFLLQKRKPNARGAYPLRMRVSLRGASYFDIPLHSTAREDEFNVKMQRVSAACPGAANINLTMATWKSKVEETVAYFDMIEKRVPTPAELEDRIKEELGLYPQIIVPERNTFFAVFQRFIDTESATKDWSKTTTTRVKNVMDSLYEFDKGLDLENLSNAELQDYLLFLIEEKGHKNSTAQKNVSTIRWFLRWAAANNLYHGHAHETFRPKFKGTDRRAKEVIYLTDEELRTLEQWNAPGVPFGYVVARDVLVFCCFTGLRYSDAEKLSKTDIKDGKYLDIVTQKTSTALRIELNSHAKAILDKYANVDLPGGKALPVLSNQKFNDYIKEVGKICGIDTPTRRVFYRGSERIEEVHPKYELLTTHVGRKTFVVQGLRLGIPAEVIMKWTGHSNYDAMRPYIDIVSELKEREMQKFDTF